MKRTERPGWWPESEPWPGKRPRWRHGPAALWRLVAALLVLLAIGIALASVVAWVLGIVPGSQSDSGGHPARFITLVGIVAAAALGVAVLVGRILRPVAGVVEAAERIAAGDYLVRLDERGPRDVRVLARAFNDMASRLEATEAQRRALLADITHELRTPLTVIQGDLEGLLDDVYPRDDQHLTTILEESRLLGRLVEDLRTLALADAGELTLHPEPTDPAGLADESVTAFGGAAADAGVTLKLEAEPGLVPVSIDPMRIRQVLSNLISNALRYTPPGGEVVVDVSRAPEDAVRFTVRDTGAGISAEDLPHVFDRFHHAPDSHGSGLGLTIARDLVEAHGGTIEAASDGSGRGTSVTFVLPD
jgi:two-component system OmpR family sensor kinase/two-component system sensor histidine kinase BaeS